MSGSSCSDGPKLHESASQTTTSSGYNGMHQYALEYICNVGKTISIKYVLLPWLSNYKAKFLVFF